MEKRVKYPIGEQDFKMLREADCVYVDKTRFIHKLVSAGSKYYFLARPRRFGKSLFLSTLRYFFEGQRQLFKGLYIDSVDWDWKPYPVLRLDLNTEKYTTPGLLEGVLENTFRNWEQKYEVNVCDTSYSQRFSTIIKAAHEKTGMPVVILVDEYDKPLVNNLNKDENFEHYRFQLAAFYSNFKSSAEHIRMVFLTGVSRFSKLSIFSDLNNINDISFSNEYADICGITEKELLEYFQQGITDLGRYNDEDFESNFKALKFNYDGYRFAERGSDIYNPWSVLRALEASTISNYWDQTGIPTIIGEALYHFESDLQEILNSQCSRRELAGLDLKSLDPLALLYQTGYLTIKDYDKEEDIYTLGIPNREVEEGLLNTLIPYYVRIKHGSSERLVSQISTYLKLGEPEKLMKALQTYFAGIPYQLKMENENNFQNAIYILLSLIGIRTKVEVSTSDGRIDLLLENSQFIYIIELKYDGTAEEALRQIEERRYARPYRGDGRKIFEIGVNFSSKTRCIEDWVISEQQDY